MSAPAMTCRECGTRWLPDGTVEWGPQGHQCTGLIEDAQAADAEDAEAEYQSWFTPPEQPHGKEGA